MTDSEVSRRPRPRATGPGALSHRTEADVRTTTSSALFLPGDSPGFRILIPAAVELMAAQGYHGTSIREIGERAGMSKTAMYHHFSSKQELLDIIVNRMLDYSFRLCREALTAADPDPRDQLRAFVETHVHIHIELRHETFMANSEIRSFESPYRERALARRHEYEAILKDIIATGLAQGTFTTADPQHAVRAILTMCSAISIWYRPDGPRSPREIGEAFSRLSLQMLGAQPQR